MFTARIAYSEDFFQSHVLSDIYCTALIQGEWWLVKGLGSLCILTFHCLPSPAWADGNLAESAGLLRTMVEHPNQSQPNPVTNHTHPVFVHSTNHLKCPNF